MCVHSKALRSRSFGFPLNQGVHTSRAIFGLTPGHCNPYTIGFDMLQFKIVQDGIHLGNVTEISSVVEGLPPNELKRTWFTTY